MQASSRKTLRDDKTQIKEALSLFESLNSDILIKAICKRMLCTEIMALSETCKQFSKTITSDTALHTYCLVVKRFKLQIHAMLINAQTDLERAQSIAKITQAFDETYSQEISLLIRKTFEQSDQATLDYKLTVLETITPILAPVCPGGLAIWAQANKIFDIEDRRQPRSFLEPLAKIGKAIGTENLKKSINFIDQCDLSNKNKMHLFGLMFFKGHRLTNYQIFLIDENIDLVVDFISKYDDFDYYGNADFFWIGSEFLGIIAHKILETDLKLAEKIVSSIHKVPYYGKDTLYVDLMLAMRGDDFKNAITLLSDSNFHIDPIWNQKYKAEIFKKTIFKEGRLFFPSKISYDEYTNIILNSIELFKKPCILDQHTLGITSTQFEEMGKRGMEWAESCERAERVYQETMEIWNEEILRPIHEHFLNVVEEQNENISICYENEYPELWLPWSKYVRESLTDERVLMSIEFDNRDHGLVIR